MWILIACLLSHAVAVRAATPTIDYLGALSDGGKKAAAAELPDAHLGARAGFDQGITHRGGFSPPLVRIPAAARDRHPQADLVVGTPGKHPLREPANPLNEDGSAKEQSSGHGLWWALGGAAAGAAAGFFLGGPIGAAIGALIGGLLGFFLGP